MSTRLTLLQYNVNKSRNKVLIGLLEDPKTAEIDILAIQEPWRNRETQEGYNPGNSPFYLIETTSEKTRAAIYVNKRIPRRQIYEIYKDTDLISLKMVIAKENIYIHNLYIEPKSHSTQDSPPILDTLQRLLRENKGGHIILGDFNLHHPHWNCSTYKKHHYIADNLLNIVTEIGAILYTPKGLATRDCQRGTHHEKITIDLLFSNLESIESLPYIRRDLEQSSDHLPIETTFRLKGSFEIVSIKAKRLWKRLDSEIFLSTLDSETLYLPSLPLSLRESIDYYIDLLTKAIEIAIDKAVPLIRESLYKKGYWT